jgi:predicted metal-dependent phosphoesterase TrpH
VRIDLHAHSTASDGVDTPTQLIEAAVRADLQVLAVTDHDTTSGWAEAAEAATRLGIGLVRGAELSCKIRGISVHMLSYLHDPEEPRLAEEMAKTRHDRVFRAQTMVQKIAADIPLTWDDVLAQTDGDATTVGRPHIADALIARGTVATRDEAFAGLLHRDSPYFVGHYAPDGVALVRMIRKAGGVPVIAHPFAVARGRIINDGDLAALACAGLAGLEGDHLHHHADDRDHAYDVAERLGLLVTGSSDYHGAVREATLGQELTEPEVFESLLAQAHGTPFLG